VGYTNSGNTQELNFKAVQLDSAAALFKAAALHAEAAAQRTWLEAKATRQLQAQSISDSVPGAARSVTSEPPLPSLEEALLLPPAEHHVHGSANSHSAIARVSLETHCPPPTTASSQNSSPAASFKATASPELSPKALVVHSPESGAINSKKHKATSQEALSVPTPSRSDASLAINQCDSEEARKAQYTTVMLRHLPSGFTREMLLRLLDTEGFVGSFDFVYLPVDFVKWQGFGYAFVNMVSHQEALRIWKHFDGFSARPHSRTISAKSPGAAAAEERPCEVSWGDPLQGLSQHIERYRNSPVMHKDVPEQFKPVTFAKGARIKFPPPSKRIRPPRLKHGNPADLSKQSLAANSDALDLRPQAPPPEAGN
jgi:hypothetical protein